MSLHLFKMEEILDNLQKRVLKLEGKDGNYWMVNTRGKVVGAPESGLKAPERKKFGNHFETKEQAEKARDGMIKLFKKI